MEVFGEFLKQAITAVFFIAVMVLAIKLGISMRKKKNLKESEKKEI